MPRKTNGCIGDFYYESRVVNAKTPGATTDVPRIYASQQIDQHCPLYQNFGICTD